MKNQIVVASIFKRIGAIFVDLLLMVVVIVCIQNWVVTPISNSVYKVDQKIERYKEVLLESYMFVSYQDAIYQLNSKIIYDENQYKSVFSDEKINSYEFFDTYFEKFINLEYALNKVSDGDKNPTNNKTFKEEYIEAKSNSSLFTLEDGKYVPVTDVDNIDLCKFYLEQYDLAYEALYNDNYEPYQLVTTINAINMMGLICCLFFTIILIILVPSLCFKNGETFGKRIMGIAVVSRKDGFRCKKMQMLVRFASFILIEILTGLMLGRISPWLIIVPIIISFSFVTYSKAHTAIHDYCAATIVVDANKCVIFENAKELEEHQKQIEDNEKKEDTNHINKNDEKNENN